MSDDARTDAATPAAVALIAAVTARDPVAVAAALRGADLVALALVLADRAAHPTGAALIEAVMRDDRLVTRIRRDNAAALQGGRWVTDKHGIQRWRDSA